MRYSTKKFKVSPSYLKAGDLISRSGNRVEFVKFLEDTAAGMKALVIRQSDKKEIEVRFKKGYDVEVLNDKAAI